MLASTTFWTWDLAWREESSLYTWSCHNPEEVLVKGLLLDRHGYSSGLEVLERHVAAVTTKQRWRQELVLLHSLQELDIDALMADTEVLHCSRPLSLSHG